VFPHFGDPAIRSRWYFVGKTLLAVAVLYLLWNMKLLNPVTFLVLLGSPKLLSAAVLCLLGSHALVALRWYTLLRTQGLDVRYLTVFRVSYPSALTGMVLPGTVGADFARIGLGLSFENTRLHELTLSVIADRFAGSLGLLAVGLIASLLCWAYLDPGSAAISFLRLVAVSMALVFGFAVTAAIVGAALAPRIGAYLRARDPTERSRLWSASIRLIEVVLRYRGHYDRLLLALGYSMLVHSLCFAALTFIAEGMQMAGSSPWNFAIAGALAGAAGNLPITPGGIGVGEAAFAQFAVWLQPTSVVPPYATAYLAYRMVVIGTLLPALAFLPSWRRARDKHA
jgi:uncharacterized protein (TIRG00374 family)